MQDERYSKSRSQVSEKKRVDIYNEDDIRGMTFGGKYTKYFVFIIGVVVSGLSLYEVFFGNFPPSFQRPMHILLMCAFTFLLFPSGIFRRGSEKEGILNIFFILLLLGSSLWAFINWNPLYVNPETNTFGVIMGLIAIIMVLEATRRAVGWPMAIIGALSLVYCFIGPYLPPSMAHRGFSLENVVIHTVVGTEGMMGLLLSISVNQILFFMMFAAFLIMSNSTNVIMNFAKAIAGGKRGGAAKVAVVSSGFLGMVSGSASGNTATTGAITIPLMKSMGYRPRLAGAIEAVSSTAGQFMPPIMGASAFIIAELTGRGYWDVCLAALTPSVIYFIYMFITIDILARKHHLLGLPKSELPSFQETFKKFLPITIPIIVLVILLSLRYSPQYSILYSILTLIVVCLPIKEQRIGIIKFFKALALTAKILIPIATSCATAGIIVGVMSLTGMGERLSYGIISFSHGSLSLALLFTLLVSLIIGMGLPTLGAYVVLATLGAPALNQLGAPLLAAHLFIFYGAILSAITPPVCLSAYVAAGISGSNPIKTGLTAVFLAPIIYIIPFMFVLNPGLILEGTIIDIGIALLKMILLFIPVSALTLFYFLEKINFIEAVLFLGVVVLIFIQKTSLLPIALGMEAIVIVIQIVKNKKQSMQTVG